MDHAAAGSHGARYRERPPVTLFMGDAALAARRAVARPGAPLAPLADALAGELAPLLARDVWLPPEKARLTRVGGRCPSDGTLLTFDPWSPRRHRCPRCGAVYDDEAHYRWWIMGYQLWLAERAVHAAALHALRGDERHAALARDILAAYTSAYLRYPNQDNVLGPTRPFFSTYLESIWLLQLTVAASLLQSASALGALGGELRERVIAPSAALIAGYDEGMSNRQVWNDAALMAAHLFLGQRDAAAALVFAPTGLAAQLAHGLLHDGSWYEGENYHLFAHRGLWYGVTLAEQAGLGPLPAELRERFAAGFALPFRTALPDLTFPARRDSQYAVSLRQWRFAELAELGLAREPGDQRLRAALARLYAADVPHGDTGRARSTAEAERNEPASALTRADLGWRSLLLAPPELPELHVATPGTELLDGQGLAVFRRDAGRAYVALDYGHGGGGHGHPDRLNVLFATGHTRWLDDPGTGSYVDPSLFWYRSTLAHHAPLVDGVSQRRVHGELLAFDEQAGAGWVDARVREAAPGVTMRRALVVMGDYWLDELTWTAAHDARIELPFHVAGARLAVGGWQAAAPAGGEEPSDGFPSLRDVERAPAIGAVTRLAADWAQGPAVIGEAQSVDAWVAHGHGAGWWRAWAPGPPGWPARRFAWLRVHGTAGRIVTVWSWRRAVQAVTIERERTVVSLADGTRHLHQRSAHGWRMDVGEEHARTVVRLAGARRGSDVPASMPTPLAAAAPGDAEPRALGQGALWRFELGAESYRASEDAWQDVGRPSATVAIGREGDSVVVEVHVRKRPLDFRPRVAHNDLDNEPADVNSDGVQLHLQAAEPASWLFVPEPDGVLRGTPSGAARAIALAATWRPVAGGYVLRCRIPVRDLLPGSSDAGPVIVRIGVAVNLTTPARERRQGQLVLGGARGEFVYLQGDRLAPDRYLPFAVPHD